MNLEHEKEYQGQEKLIILHEMKTNIHKLMIDEKSMNGTLGFHLISHKPSRN